ncbi:hypothetical protein SLS53_009449 [Cytospora paraplurivora]|uniref:Uncharacterized protein n=1 Tax=Cytospora paraplurivora TaxID=2898453 RepID=A0AAN9YBW4_9PEZI
MGWLYQYKQLLRPPKSGPAKEQTKSQTPRNRSLELVLLVVSCTCTEGVLSSDSSANIKLEPQGPPNGGLKAWLQILGAFFLYFNTWGIVSSYGTYERHYEDSYLRKGGSFELSTIGSVQAFMMVFLGFIAGPIFDKGYFPHLLRFGTLMILLGTITQAFSKSYWELLLSRAYVWGSVWVA